MEVIMSQDRGYGPYIDVAYLAQQRKVCDFDN